jgi:hypothetical protein
MSPQSGSHPPLNLTSGIDAFRPLLLFLGFFLAACSSPAGTSLAPTVGAPGPVETSVLEPVPEIKETPAPIGQSTPAVVIEPPLPVPTSTPAPASVGVPQEELAIFLPGPGSQVISPIQVQGYGGPSQNNRVELRLIGEDGRVISRGYTFLYSYPGRPGLYYGQVPFDTTSLAELAWLQVRSYGDRYGLLKHLTTMPVTLLTSGSPRTERNLHGPEKITIFRPIDETNLKGPTVRIEGAAWLDEDRPLGVEILDLRGEVLAAGEAEVQAPSIGALGTFEVELEVTLPRSQWIRIGVFERGGAAVDVVHYSSVQVWFIP